jgi:hypothetical protein
VPSLISILVPALAQHGIVLDNLRAYTRPDHVDPDLHYCVTWGAGRYAAGTLRWWPDVQRLADEPQRLFERFPDWVHLVLTIGSVLGLYGAEMNLLFTDGRRLGRVAISADMRRKPSEGDAALRSRLANAVGGDELEYAVEDPREGLVAEAATPPAEPRRAHERLLDDDDLV